MLTIERKGLSIVTGLNKSFPQRTRETMTIRWVQSANNIAVVEIMGEIPGYRYGRKNRDKRKGREEKRRRRGIREAVGGITQVPKGLQCKTVISAEGLWFQQMTIEV